jgi:hypothetical protein
LAYKQSVAERFRQDHASYRHLATFNAPRKGKELIVRVGRLARDGYSVGRITRQFVEDVEAALINVNKPKFNSPHKKAYNGRPLVVVNAGAFKPLNRYAQSIEAAFTRWCDDGGWHEAQERIAEAEVP